jgi:hypothetical protein
LLGSNGRNIAEITEHDRYPAGKTGYLSRTQKKRGTCGARHGGGGVYRFGTYQLDSPGGEHHREHSTVTILIGTAMRVV